MSEEILINVTPQETRVAVVENGVLQEVCIERTRQRGLVGNIYKGCVSRVMPGMDAAFVDIGREKAAFIHASDVAPWWRNANEDHAGAANNHHSEPVGNLLHEGQQLLVQVVKDQISHKGARLTTHITIPSRHLVLMPNTTTIGLSARLENEAERTRLREIVERLMETTGQQFGCIVRTAAEYASEDALGRDLRFLQKLWNEIHQRVGEVAPVAEVYADLPLALRTLRDLAWESVEKVRIDSRETYHSVNDFVRTLVPEMAGRIQHYPGERPIFDLYGIEDEIQKAMQRQVQLKSGGHLVFDQTEAMTTIDVNTGGFVGNRNLEETTFKTNMEAAQAIARQLRLRNLGGIIIIDFIDMGQDDHKRQVIRALERALERDHAKSRLSDVSTLGLVEMTRERTRESLERILCEPCKTCEGRGTLKTPVTVCYELFREILRESRQFDTDELLVLASQEVVDLLLDEESASLAELEEFIGKSIKFQVEALYTQEQFDVVLI